MASNAFDRVVINARERPVSTDINQLQSQIDRTLRVTLEEMFRTRLSDTDDSGAPSASGFLGEALKPRPSSPASMNIRLPKGLGFFYNITDTPTAIGGVTNLDDLSYWKPISIPADLTVPVPTADPTNPRYDIIEVRTNRLLTDSTSRDVFNVSTGIFDPTAVSKTLSTVIAAGDVTVDGTGAVNLRTGAPNASPTVPATDSGYTKIAEILVGTGVTTLDADVIKDLRMMIWPGSQAQISTTFVAKGSGASLLPTSLQVVSPPGIQICAVGNNLTGQTVDVFMIIGGMAATMRKTYTVSAQTYLSPGCVRAYFAGASPVAVDSIIQAAMANAAIASPVTKVAIGQVVYWTQLKSTVADSGTNDVRYNLLLNVHN